MPKIGLANNKWAAITTETAGGITYDTAATLGGAVSATFTPNFSATPHYSDNVLKNQINRFSNGALAAQVDDVDIATQAKIYGATYTTTEGLKHNKADVPPFGGLSFYETILTKDNDLIYRGYFYPKVKAVRTAENFATEQEQIALGMTDLSFTAFADSNGLYELISPDFATESNAVSWVSGNFT